MSVAAQPVSEQSNLYREQRLENMRQLAALGQKPFGHAWPRTGRLAEIRLSFEEGKTVSAGPADDDPGDGQGCVR